MSARSLSLALLAIASSVLSACATAVPGTADVPLDNGTSTSDKVLPKLVSQDAAPDLTKPVIVAVHGFTATPFETSLVAEFLRNNGYLVSQVRLGAHGESYKAFANSGWATWQQPILDEYTALRSKGFAAAKIGMLTCSTGGPLLMQALAGSKLTFDGKAEVPRRIAMVAPLLEFSNKMIGYAGILGLLGTSFRDTADPNELAEVKAVTGGNWYRFQPITALTSLVDLTEIVKGNLRTGIKVPAETRIHVYQADKDPTVDQAGSVFIPPGFTKEGTRLNVTTGSAPADLVAKHFKSDSRLTTDLVTRDLVDSKFHIPTWPDGVDGLGTELKLPGTDKANDGARDRTLRGAIFDELLKDFADLK
jgi:carboxylesterase